MVEDGCSGPVLGCCIPVVAIIATVIYFIC